MSPTEPASASEDAPGAGLQPPVSATTPAQRRRAFLVLFGCLMTSGIGNSILFAVLPSLAREIELPEVAVGLVYTVSAVLFMVMSQVWGRASDRFGRRPIILLGLIGYSASSFVFATVVEFGRRGAVGALGALAMMMLARALFGAIGSAAGPAAQAYVADRTAPHERTEAIAGLTAAFGFGAAIGPGFAGWLAPYVGLVAPLYVVSVFGVAGALAVRSFLPERTPPKERPAPGGEVRRAALAGDQRLRVILVASALIWVVQATSLQTVGFLVIDRMVAPLGLDDPSGRATQLAGIALTVSALAMLAAQLGVIRQLHPGPKTALIAGACVTCAGASVMAAAGDMVTLTVSAAMMGFGMGLARPGAAAAASLAVEPEEQGAAAGLVAATAGVGFLTAPVTGLLLYQMGPGWAPFALSAVFSAAVVALALTHPAIARAAARANRRAA